MFGGLLMPRLTLVMRSRGFGTDPAFAAWRSIAGTPVARTVAASAAGGSVASRGGGSAGPAVVLGRYDSDEVEVGLDEFWQSTGLNTPHAGDPHRSIVVPPMRRAIDQSTVACC